MLFLLRFNIENLLLQKYLFVNMDIYPKGLYINYVMGIILTPLRNLSNFWIPSDHKRIQICLIKIWKIFTHNGSEAIYFFIESTKLVFTKFVKSLPNSFLDTPTPTDIICIFKNWTNSGKISVLLPFSRLYSKVWTVKLKKNQ